MKKITKLQSITIIALLLYGLWELYVKKWEMTLPPGDPVIRVDLFLIIPILLGLCIASLVQLKNKKLRWIIVLGAAVLAIVGFLFGNKTANESMLSGSPARLEIVNANPAVQNFLLAAKNKPFAQQKRIWLDNVEVLAPEFYQNHIWGALYDPKGWEAQRDNDLREIIKDYESLSPEKISAAYTLYEESTKNVLAKFQKYFPDYQPDLKVMIVPGIGWGGSYIPEEDVEYLALGVDRFLAKDASPINVMPLISHELFHDYHAQKRGIFISGETYTRDSKLFWQLWDEGMATWGMGHLANNQTADYVMLLGMDTYDQCNDVRLAKLFLEEFDNKGVDREHPVNYKKWFGVSQTKTLGEDTPPMVGYYLGWRVIRGIEESGISPDVFLSWNYEQARPHIAEQLKRIANETTCKIQ